MFTPKQQHLMDLAENYARAGALVSTFIAITGADNELTELSADDAHSLMKLRQAKDQAKTNLEIAVKMI